METIESLNNSALSNNKSANFKGEHNTVLSKVLQAKHNNVHNIVGAIQYKFCFAQESQIDEVVRKKRMLPPY